MERGMTGFSWTCFGAISAPDSHASPIGRDLEALLARHARHGFLVQADDNRVVSPDD